MDRSGQKTDEKESILVVDDDEITCRSLELVFKRKGFESEIARTGSEAIEKVRDRFFNVALLDIKLPDMEGTELVQTLKEIHPLMSVIMVTGYASMESAAKAMNEGATGYICKPLDMDELFAYVEKALEKQKLEIENRRLFEETKRELSRRKRAEARLAKSRDELRSLSGHLQTVREEERRQIAREIHDELGQSLTALKMNLSSLVSKIPDNKKSLLHETKSMLRIADRSIQMVKKISTELRPGLLDDLGLSAAIHWQVEEFKHHTGINCNVSLEGEERLIDQGRSVAIFRIVQETLTNVARHANATEVNVSLSMKSSGKSKSDQLILKVIDNGDGISEENILSPNSIGLIGMRERVYPWGGEISIKGREGVGTAVTVAVPLNSREK